MIFEIREVNIFLSAPKKNKNDGLVPRALNSGYKTKKLVGLKSSIWVFPKIGGETPQNGWWK